MANTITPMIHVPDVRATAEWYRGIGFELVGAFGCDGDEGELSWAKLSFGASDIMLNIGGHSSDAERREFDLYIVAENVDEMYAHVKDKAEIVEDLHDTEYGMREFIIRDLNRFWITFGQPVG